MSYSKNPRSNIEYNDVSEGSTYKYDVAVSYDSHCKDLVKEIVLYLQSEKFEVFFDEDKRLELLSENLKAKLYQIYQNESLIKVLFITDEYLKNEFTLLEARRSLISAKENHRRLIIINFIGKELPTPYNNFAYLDGKLPADEIAYIIGERIRELKRRGGEEPQRATISVQNLNLIYNNEGDRYR